VTHGDIDAGPLTIGVGPRRITVPSVYLRSGAIEYGSALKALSPAMSMGPL